MHKIYFEKRCIIICRPDDQILSDPNMIQFRSVDKAGLQLLIGMVEVSDEMLRICIPSDDVDGTYRDLCKEFTEVNAGGGLVSNQRGDFLLISRNGMWDLPKGHQEPGEDIRQTAYREVAEETGIDTLEIHDLICVTDHCYRRNGEWYLKHTWWYDMLHTDPHDLTPQKEEDITKAAWVAKSSLTPYLLNTYPSIVEVFREAGI